MSSSHCKNCLATLTGKYCAACGQSADIHRITAHYFLHDIPHSVFHIDKGFFYTLKQLFINPGKTLAGYLDGKRVLHFRPFGYVLILSALYVFLFPQIDHLGEYIAGKRIYIPMANRSFFEKYISILIFLLIPVLSLVTWLSFKKATYNYWEHFLINTYLGAQTILVLLGIKLFGLLKISLGLSPNVNFTVAMFIFMFYYSFAFVWLMKRDYKRLTISLHLLGMNFLLSFIYITAFSLSGIMTPWWGN
jgi:Protein of unknown function (DUF3667)